MSVETTSADIFRTRAGLVSQRAMAFVEYDDIPAALREPDFDAPPPGETAVLVSDRGLLYELSLVAGFVWDSLSEPRSGEELGNRVAEVFEVDVETATRDVRQLIAELAERGLVVEVGA
jgi:hypothetical protein